MVPIDTIVEPPKEEEKHVLSRDAKILREEMIGYVDAILERQDKADIIKKIETF